MQSNFDLDKDKKLSLLPEHVFLESLGGNIGLALTQAMGLTVALQRGMRLWGELENQMISVERIQEYIDLPPEVDNQIEPPKSWPQCGRLEYQEVFVRYLLYN